MHNYDAENRGSVEFVIAGISFLLVWIINWALGNVKIELEWWMIAPSFGAIYKALHWTFDRHLWRFKLLSFLRLTHLPDINGKWLGNVDCSFDEGCGKHPVIVDIRQHWTKKSVTATTHHSRSKSITAYIHSADQTYPEFSYQYFNEPLPNRPNAMGTHRGTATLFIDNSTIVGEFYTGRGRIQEGSIKLSKEQRSRL